MGSTKIFVVQLRQLIKSFIFVIIGLVLIGVIIYFFIPKERAGQSPPPPRQQQSQYVPGTYAISLPLSQSPVKVLVNVSEKEIVSINLEQLTEQQEALYPLIKPTLESLSQEILKHQYLVVPKTDKDAENAVTSQVLLDAIKAALVEAESKGSGDTASEK